MLFISIPTGVRDGQCRINGESCDFRITGGEFWFKVAGDPESAWDKRKVVQASPSGELTQYVCSNGVGEPGGGNPVHIFDGTLPEREVKRLVKENRKLLMGGHSTFKPGGFPLFADARCPDVKPTYEAQVGKATYRRHIERAAREGTRPMSVIALGPAELATLIETAEDDAQRALVKQVREMSNYPGRAGAVPVVLMTPTSYQVFWWSPSGNVPEMAAV